MTIGIDARMYRSTVAGIGRYSQNLIKNLLEIDSENRYVFFMRPEDIKEVDQKSLIRNPKHKIIEIDVAHYSVSEQTTLINIIASQKIDLMFFTNTNYPIRYRGKFVVAIHDLTLYFFPNTARKNNFLRRKAFNLVLKRAVKNSTKIITDSENTKKDILEVFHPNPKKISVVMLAADDRKFANAPEAISKRLKMRYKINSPMILSVGQFRAHKNIPNLIRAFNLVRAKMPAKLVLIGKPDPSYQKLNETIDKSPYKSDIVMPGFVSDEDLSGWYKLATCYAFPSLYEGFGLPALEAMMAGKAVVCSNRSSLPEVCLDGALYFDPLKITDIADKIEEVLTNKDMREQLAARGKEIAQRYSWRKTAKETLKILNSV